MKKFNRILGILCSLLLLCPALPFTFPAHAAENIKAEALTSAPATDVTFAPTGTDNTRALGGDDVLVAQIVLTGDATTLSLPVTGAGSVRVTLFPFVETYDISLLQDPIADHIFERVSGKTYLTFTFPSDAPLSAGEYLVTLYDASGVSALTRAKHTSQRTFLNGKLNTGLSLPISVKYVKTPSSLYGQPSVPVDITDNDPAPHMTSVLYFDQPTGVTVCGGSNNLNVSYKEADGSGFTRFQPPTDASDPYVVLNLPGTPPKTEEYRYLLMKVRLDEGAPRKGQMYFVTDESGLQEPASIHYTYADSTDWQYLILDLGQCSLYTGQLKALRFDVFESVSGSHYADVAYMALFKTKEAAAAFHDNFSDYAQGDATTPEKPAPDYSTYVDHDTPAPAESGKLVENGQLSYQWKQYTYAMDMSKTVDEYVAVGNFGFFSLSDAIILDGQLRCRAFGSYAFFTEEMLGDIYGLRGGELSMDLVLSYGSVSVTLRQIQKNDDLAYSGICFTLTPDGTIAICDRDGFTSTCATGFDLSAPHRVTFADRVDTLEVRIDDTTVCSLSWDFYTGHLSDGTTTMAAPHLPGAGYATVKVNRARGYIDNVSYTHTDVISLHAQASATLPVDYSTWVATDDLGRTTPMEVTATDGEKYVGLFYFMFHNFMAGRQVNDVTRMYLEDGFDTLCKTLSSYAGRNGAYWAEPYFGYYSSFDTWVFRKHAYMLDAAGVDFVFLDLSNNVFYTTETQILFDTWLQIRREGGSTPQICFMFGDMPFTFVNGVYTMLPFLENPEYQELLFCWEGKPLILGNNDATGDNRRGDRFKTWTVSGSTPQTRDQFTNMINDNPDVKDFWNTRIDSILENYTVRKCWAWQNARYKGYWDWLQDSPQSPGRDFEGNVEQMSVGMGTHAHTNRGRSLTGNDTGYNTLGEFGFTLGTAKYGYFFAEQFEYALEQNVSMIMITGWNEWYAGVQSTSNQEQICGGTSTPGYYMVDQMSPEYSRDGEPMRIRDGVGFGDNYYYQMVSYIRRFKGITAPATVNGGAIDMTAAPDAQWEGITPVFTDHVGDNGLRSDLSWAAEFLYVNGTARNDIAYAKVTQDREKLYFYVTTATPMIIVDDDLWMNLYLDADNDPSTGWEGYDYLINRSRTDKTVTVETFVDGQWQFETVGTGTYVLGDNSLTIALDKSLIGGRDGEAMSFAFKWADHANVAGDIMRFMELADTAPSDRFAFAYRASSVEDERAQATETDTQPETQQVTDAETQAPASLPTDQETDAPATMPATDAPQQTTDDGGKGCRSAMSGAGICALLGLAATATVGQKRKQRRRQ